MCVACQKLKPWLKALNKPEESAKSAEKSTTAGFGEGYTLGINLVVSTIVGGAMGYGLDKLFGTLPLFLLVMMVLGFVAGMRTIWQGLNAAPVVPKQTDDTEKKGD